MEPSVKKVPDSNKKVVFCELRVKKSYFVYILTNKSYTLYIGITSNLAKRIWEHKSKFVDGFTKRYNIDKLIYYEEYDDVRNTIEREKQIKGWVRSKKIALIKSLNPNFEEMQL